jgi:Na+-driven multidrug efflux pump
MKFTRDSLANIIAKTIKFIFYLVVFYLSCKFEEFVELLKKPNFETLINFISLSYFQIEILILFSSGFFFIILRKIINLFNKK